MRRDDAGAARDRVGIGDAAVALQHPGVAWRHLEVLGADALCARRCARAASARAQASRPDAFSRMKASKRAASAAWMSRKKNDGALLGQRCEELAAQIAVDLDDGDEQREAEAEREHDARRQRAGPVDVGEGQPQHGRARPRHAPAIAITRRRDQPQRRRTCRPPRRRRSRRCAGRRRASPPAPPAATVDRGQHHIDHARPAPLGRHLVAEQRRDRHVVGAAERPERERERGEQAVEQRERESAI